MKTSHTLFLALLALCVISTGCARGGGPNLPQIISVSPGEGAPNDAVELNIEKFDERKDIILFGGVPVKPTVIPVAGSDESALAETGSAAPAMSLSSYAKNSTTIIVTQKPLYWSVRVPGLDPGDIEITIRRGDHETDPVSFTVLGGTIGSDKEEVTPEGSDTPPSTDTADGDEVIHPEDGTTTDTDDTTPEVDAGDETPPETEEFHPSSVVSLNYSLVSGFNYVKLQWSLAYVESAFIRVPINYVRHSYGGSYVDPISFGQFRGSSWNPFPFSPRTNEEGLLAELATTVMDGAFGSMPYNYCFVPKVGLDYLTGEECYSTERNDTSYNYIDIAVPLASGQQFKNGTWKFRLPARQNVFAVYYRDWESNLKKTHLKIRSPF